MKTDHDPVIEGEARMLIRIIDSWLRKQTWHRRDGGWRPTGSTEQAVTIGAALDQELNSLGVAEEPDPYWSTP